MASKRSESPFERIQLFALSLALVGAVTLVMGPTVNRRPNLTPASHAYHIDMI